VLRQAIPSDVVPCRSEGFRLEPQFCGQLDQHRRLGNAPPFDIVRALQPPQQGQAPFGQRLGRQHRRNRRRRVEHRARVA